MSTQVQTAWIGLGANLGDARAALCAAVQCIAALPSTHVTQVSSLYGSAPVDASGPDYLNAVVEISTALAPLELLDALQNIELDAGRERPYRNAPRTLDLDIVRFADLTLNTERLTLPHPRSMERAFVLRPLSEFAHTQVTAAQLKAVADQRIECLVEGPSWCGAIAAKA